MKLDGFTDIVPLGSGGLGDVYRARRTSTGALVAIKVLRDWSDESAAWQRAQRELRALVDLRGHPFVVHVEEVVEVDGVPHLVMEHAPGGSIADLLKARGHALDVGEVVLIGEQTASALAASHRRGIIHLDIKPQNLLIGPFGQVKVCDFGIAALTRTEQFRERTSAASYRYASPEQLDEAEEVGPPADVYALGATLIHLLTGRPLSVRDGDRAADAALAAWPRPAGLDPAMGDRLVALLQSCVALDPAQRPTIDAVHDDLESIGAALGDLRCKALPLTAVAPSATATIPRPAAASSPTLPPPTVSRPSEPVTGPPPPPVTRRSRRGLLIGVAAAVLALVVVGVLVFARGGGGDDNTAGAAPVTTTAALAADTKTSTSDAAAVTVPSTTAKRTTTTSSTSTSTTTTTLVKIEIPDVDGDDLASAQAAIAKAGLTAEVVTVEGPGPYDKVVDVAPRSGTEVGSGATVKVTVNKQPATMPQAIGINVAAATRLLESYGIDVTTTNQVSEAATDGAVVDQTPKPGEPFAATVTLVVNRQPAITFLSDLSPVQGGVQTGQAQVNGTVYTRSVLLDPNGFDPSFAEYDLARKYTRLVGTVGTRDDVNSTNQYRVEIYGDGAKLAETDLGLGQAVPIDIDVTNVLRLRLQVTQLVGETYQGHVVFADTRILGDPDVVPTTTTPG